MKFENWLRDLFQIIDFVLFFHFSSFTKKVYAFRTHFFRSISWSNERMIIAKCKPIPVLKPGVSLCSFSHKKKPDFITGTPANGSRFFPFSLVSLNTWILTAIKNIRWQGYKQVGTEGHKTGRSGARTL